MDEQHTPETEINFVFYLIYLIFSFKPFERFHDWCYELELWLFQIFTCVVHIVGILFIYVQQISFWFGVFLLVLVIYTYEHTGLIFFCELWFVFCYFCWFIFIVNVYVCRHKYNLGSHSFVYMHYFYVFWPVLV